MQVGSFLNNNFGVPQGGGTGKGGGQRPCGCNYPVLQYDVEIEEGDEPETKEAWKLPQEKKSKLGLNVAMLMVIGKLHF